MKIRTFALAMTLLAAPAALAAQVAPPATPRAEDGRQHREREMRRERGPRAGMERRARGEGRQLRNPIAGMLERRQQLNLSADQVNRLQAIQSRLESQNRPLVERMQALRGQPGDRPGARGGELTPEQRAQIERTREQFRPIAEQLRENRQTAMRDAVAVLTDAQRQQIRQFHREHGERRGMRGRQGRERREGIERRERRERTDRERTERERVERSRQRSN